MEWLSFSIIVLLLSYLGSRGTSYDKYFQFLLAICLAYVVGFGGISSADHFEYALLFNNMDNSWNDKFSLGRVVGGLEWGYMGLNYLAKKIGLGEAGFFSLIAFITNFFIIINIFRYSKHCVYACILFILSDFYMQEPNLIRQTLSASIVFFSFRYLEEEKTKLFVLFVFIASLIHVSAIFFLILLLAKFVDFEKKRNTILIALFVFWTFSLLILYGIIHSDFLSFANVFVRMRSGDSIMAGEGDVFVRNIQNDVFNVLVLIVFLYYYLINTKAKFGIFTVLFFMGPILYNLGVNNYGLFRFAFYFFPLIYIVIPNVLYDISLRGKNKDHIVYNMYMIWNLSILVRAHIMSDHPRFFDMMYSFKDFFA